MAKTHIKTVLGALFAAVLTLTAVATVPALADEDSTGGYNVQVSPPTQKLTLQPGEVYEGSFKVSNIGEETFTYTLDSVPYSVSGENYDPDYRTETSYNQLYKWVKFDKSTGSVDPNNINEVHFTITVPEDVPNGGQYAALTTSVNNGETGNLQTVTRVAMIIYARIPGQTREEGQILENKVPSIVFGGSQITATSLLNNTGNVHNESTSTLKVYPFGSDEEIYTNEENPATHIIMPETTRYVTETWEDTPALGLYTVEHTVEYLGETSTTRKLVLVCPLWLLVIFIALIFAIIFTIVSRARARKTAAAESSSKREKKSDKEED